MTIDNEQLIKVTIREYIERIIEERDKQYDIRFRASEVAVNAALAAQEKAVNAAFSASEKAITKQEESQVAYNARSNEFRAALADQAKDFMPRTETVGLFKSVDQKLEAVQSNYENRVDAVRVSFEKSIDVVTKDIANLREYRSEVSGKALGINALWGYVIAIVTVAVAIVSHFFQGKP